MTGSYLSLTQVGIVPIEDVTLNPATQHVHVTFHASMHVVMHIHHLTKQGRLQTCTTLE